MTDLQTLHSQATKLILSLREGVERLESTDIQYSSPALIREMQRLVGLGIRITSF